jgi:hypothetical protein
MGFASMFEDIIEALELHSEVRSIVARELGRVASRRTSEALQPKTRHGDDPSLAFTEKVSHLLTEDGCPSYLTKHYLNWIWQYIMGRKSMDQIWLEFERLAIPLMTPYLQRGDPITLAFVEKYLLIKNSHAVR